MSAIFEQLDKKISESADQISRIRKMIQVEYLKDHPQYFRIRKLNARLRAQLLTHKILLEDLQRYSQGELNIFRF